MVACHVQLRPQLCLRITNNPTSHPENDTEKKELNGNDKVDTTTAQTDSPADVTKSEPVAPATTTTAATTEPESKTDAKAEKVAEKKAEEKVAEPAPAVAADKKVADKVEDVKPTKVEDKRKDLILSAQSRQFKLTFCSSYSPRAFCQGDFPGSRHFPLHQRGRRRRVSHSRRRSNLDRSPQDRRVNHCRGCGRARCCSFGERRRPH